MTPRYLADFQFPSHTYVPGRTPRHADEALFSDPAAALDPDRYAECHAYLAGVELFNAGYYWEAHEVWEGLWHMAGRSGLVADFLKGLIKWAAAGVKLYEGRRDGVRRHAARAGELLLGIRRCAAPEGRFAGVELDAVIVRIGMLDRATAEPTPSGSSPPLAGLLGVIELNGGGSVCSPSVRG